MAVDPELSAVKTVKAFLRGKPHKASPVLNACHHCIARQAVVICVLSEVIRPAISRIQE